MKIEQLGKFKKIILKKGECIDGALIPCEKARKYLEKHGLLCNKTEKQNAQATAKVTRKKRKNWVKEWFY